MFKCKVCVVVLVGIPAAGKTTFCKELAINFKQENIKLSVISYDELCTDNTSNARKVVFNDVTQLIHRSLNDNFYHAIIIDDNMFYKSMRKEYKTLCKTLNIGYFETYFKVDLDTALTRNETRGSNKIPQDIIIDMNERLEVPINDVFIIDSNFCFNDAVFIEFNEFLVSAFNNPKVLIVNEKLEPSPLSKMQVIDLVLRNIVHEKIGARKGDGKKVNLIKKTLFERIKNGDIVLNGTDEATLRLTLLPYFDI